MFGVYEKRSRMIFDQPFLSLTAKFGLLDYVRIRLDEEGYQYQGGILLLGHCIELLVDQRKTVYPLSQPELVAILLRHGGIRIKTIANSTEGKAHYGCRHWTSSAKETGVDGCDIIT